MCQVDRFVDDYCNIHYNITFIKIYLIAFQ